MTGIPVAVLGNKVSTFNHTLLRFFIRSTLQVDRREALGKLELSAALGLTENQLVIASAFIYTVNV